MTLLSISYVGRSHSKDIVVKAVASIDAAAIRCPRALHLHSLTGHHAARHVSCSASAPRAHVPTFAFDDRQAWVYPDCLNRTCATESAGMW